jgi:hypothetical protein
MSVLIAGLHTCTLAAWKAAGMHGAASTCLCCCYAVHSTRRLPAAAAVVLHPAAPAADGVVAVQVLLLLLPLPSPVLEAHHSPLPSFTSQHHMASLVWLSNITMSPCSQRQYTKHCSCATNTTPVRAQHAVADALLHYWTTMHDYNLGRLVRAVGLFGVCT